MVARVIEALRVPDDAVLTIGTEEVGLVEQHLPENASEVRGGADA